jgi:hypothetical protein
MGKPASTEAHAVAEEIPPTESKNSTDLDRASAFTPSRNGGLGGSRRSTGLGGQARPRQPCGASDCRMNKNPADASQPYRSLIAGYTDAIRASDFKANIAILFVAFMMGPVLGNYTRFPSYLPIAFVMLPFLIVYLCLFAVLIPRYPRRGSKNFLVSRTATAGDFMNVAETEDEIEQLKLRCAVLSELLWWKTLYIRISFSVSMVSIILTVCLLIYIWYT